MKVFKNGLITGLILQFAIGPVFLFIINLALQRTILDGLAGALAVTLVDYFYITLAILGVGKLLENRIFKKVFGIVSSIVLVVFGLLIIKDTGRLSTITDISTGSTTLISSFTSVFFLTISSPLTIIFFTSLFTTKAVEYNYLKKDLLIFGLGTGFATFLFMSSSIVIFSLIKATVPILLMLVLNLIVACVLIVYGAIRLIKVIKVAAPDS